MTGIKTTADVMEWLGERTREAQEKMDQKTADEPKQLFLPGLEDTMRALPNAINRSSLFAPIARGRRKYYQEQAMVSRADIVISYTGQQLDEADADLTFQLLFDAKVNPLGQPIFFKRSDLLKAMGRCVGKHDYEWLHRRMKALTESTIFIEAKRQDGTNKYRIGHTKAFHILADFEYNAESETYSYTLDPRWVVLFSNREYALIDWNKRLQISTGQDLAKALQRLFATSNSSPQKYALDWLREKMQYTSPMHKFRTFLDTALIELKRVELVTDWKFEKSTRGKPQLSVTF